MYKRLMSLLFCVIAGTGIVIAKPEDFENKKLNKSEAGNYCRKIITRVCGNNLDTKEGINISAKVMLRLLKKRWWWQSVSWKQEEVYEATMNGLVDYVEEQTFLDAKKETGNCEVTHRITNEIRDELLNKMSYAAEFKKESLKEYVGEGLKFKIFQLSYRYLPPWQRTPNRTDSVACCKCNAKFAPGSQWTYLVCGHNLCITCAEKFSHAENVRCPKCNWPINSKLLRYKLDSQ
jgi:hypothetical protein